jgi:putative MATE family efflux protein
MIGDEAHIATVPPPEDRPALRAQLRRYCPGMHGRDRTILRLAVPALATLAVEPLYVLVDTAIVGHLGTVPLGGLALASTVLNFAFVVFNFLAYGTTARVAFLTGAGDRRGAARFAVQGLWVAVASGAALAVVIASAAGPLASALGGKREVHAAAVTYLRISALGGPLTLVALVGNGYLRGVQDTRTPMVIVVVANVVNLVIELLLVYGLDLGVAGSAWGTVIAQALAAAWFLAVLVPRILETQASMRPVRSELAQLVRFARHLFVRTASLIGTLTLSTALAARVGKATLAGHHLALQLMIFLALLVDSLAIAGQTLIGTALGAGRPEEARAWGRRLLGGGILVGAGLALTIAALAPVLPKVFSGDPAVQVQARSALFVLSAILVPAAAVYVLDGVLIGASDTRTQQWGNVIAFLVFAPIAVAILYWHLGIVAIWMGLGAWLMARLVVNALRVRGSRWTAVAAELSVSPSLPLPGGVSPTRGSTDN